MSTTYAYLRVSGESQAQDGKDGIRRQEEACAAVAQALGRKIDHWIYDRGVSGTKPWFEREGFRDMRNRMEKGDVLIVEDIDRIGRDTLQTLIILDDLRNTIGVTIYTANQNELKTDATSQFMQQVISATAAYMRYMIVSRLKQAKVAAKAQGRRVNGRYPYGWHEHEKEGVRVILDAAKRGLTLHQIARELEAAGIKPRGGGEKWSIGTIHNVISRNAGHEESAA